MMQSNSQACARCGSERFVLSGPKPNLFFYDAPLFMVCIECGLVNPAPPRKSKVPVRRARRRRSQTKRITSLAA